MTFPLRVFVDASRRVVIEGEATIRLTDFGVRPPTRMGVISVEDTVKVWLSLRARATGTAG